MSQKAIPILDFDDLITAIQALSAPSGTDVAISPTGMHIITEDDAQGAFAQLDTAVDSVNSSLTNLVKTANTQLTNESFNAGQTREFTGTPTAVDGYKPIAIVGLAKNGTNQADIVISAQRITSTGGYSLTLKNTNSSSVTLTSFNIIILYERDI